MTEKDLEMAKAMREYDETHSQLKQSMAADQNQVIELRAQISTLEEAAQI